MPDLDEDKLAPSIQGSDLCLACGLCCTALFHRQALLQPDELNLAETLGLIVRSVEENLSFQLPCPCFRHGRCTVYPNRPKVCRSYQCKLLRALKNREIELDAALKQVERVKALLAEIEILIGDTNHESSIWSRARNFAVRQGLVDDVEFIQVFPLLGLKLGILSLLCNRHFDFSEEGTPYILTCAHLFGEHSVIHESKAQITLQECSI